MCKQAIKLEKKRRRRRNEANIRAWLSAILNTFLWRLEDWFWSCDVMGLESLGFCLPHDNDKPAFRFAPFCTAISKVSVFGNRIHRLCVNGRSKRREKNAFLYENMYVWTQPNLGRGTIVVWIFVSKTYLAFRIALNILWTNQSLLHDLKRVIESNFGRIMCFVVNLSLGCLANNDK